MKSAPCEEKHGERREELPKCFPHLYVDEMPAVSLESKCLVWTDFPARFLVSWDMPRWGSESHPCLWLLEGFQEDPFCLLCLSALSCKTRGLDELFLDNHSMWCLSDSNISEVVEMRREKSTGEDCDKTWKWIHQEISWGQNKPAVNLESWKRKSLHNIKWFADKGILLTQKRRIPSGQSNSLEGL